MGAARLVVVAGPSGVGKGSLITLVRQQQPEVWLSVSATTRQPRAGEVDGQSYFFLSRADFEAKIAADAMLEWAEYSGNLYGTPLEPVVEHLARGIHVLLEIEVKGARQIKDKLPDALLVFIKPPSWEELERRLRGRGTEDEAALELRLETARLEMASEGEFDEVIVNDDLGKAAGQLVSLIRRP